MLILASSLFGFLSSCLPPLTFQNSLHSSISRGQKVSSWKKQEWDRRRGRSSRLVASLLDYESQCIRGSSRERSWPPRCVESADLQPGVQTSIWGCVSPSARSAHHAHTRSSVPSLPTTIVLSKTLALKTDLTKGSTTSPGMLLEMRSLRLSLGPTEAEQALQVITIHKAENHSLGPLHPHEAPSQGGKGCAAERYMQCNPF